MEQQEMMERTRRARSGDSIDRICRRFYDVYEYEGTVDEARMHEVRMALGVANPTLAEDLSPGQFVRLPTVRELGPLPSVHIESVEAFREHVSLLCKRVNRDPVLGACFLVDPVAALWDLDYSFSDQVERQLSRSTLGYSRSQADAYSRVTAEGYIAGFPSVRLRPHREVAPVRNKESGVDKPGSGENPIGDYDTVFELGEKVVDGIAKLAYDEGVFPHRVSPGNGNQNAGMELIIGRPESVDFDTASANRVRLRLPFAVAQGASSKRGKLTIEAGVHTIETKGKPAHLGIDPKKVASVSIQSTEFTQQEIATYEALVSLYLLPHFAKVPLSPILSPVAQKGAFLKLEVTDLAFKVHNAADPNKLDSLAVCLNFTPNDSMGSLAKLTQFATTDWAIGAHERILKQKFSTWWSSSEAQKFQRLNRDKLENFKSLPQNKRDEIFDPNGDIHVGEVDFSVKNGIIPFSVKVTVENAVLWIDVDATLTGDISLGVNKKNQLTVSVSNVDSSVSCWSKFLIALFCTFLGFIAGGIIGGILGGVVGGIVGISIGAAIGATTGTLVGMIVGIVLPAVAEALIQNKLNALQDIELLDLTYDWQIPSTTKTISAAAEWIKILPGEVLVGGKVKLPLQASTAVSIATTPLSGVKTPVTLPWISADQLAKVGSSPNYFVTSKIECKVNAGSGLEKPFSFIWKVAGKPLSGQGEKLEVIVTPSMTNTLKLEPAPMVPSGAADIPQSSTYTTVPAIQIVKTIRVVQTDGTKGAPLVMTEIVKGPVNELGNSTALEVEVTDAFLTTASAKHTLSVQVLGDYLTDWWAKNKHKYTIAVHPDEMVGPWSPDFPGGGLPLPDGLIVQWRNEFAGQIRDVAPIGRENALLALNIEGAERLDEGEL